MDAILPSVTWGLFNVIALHVARTCPMLAADRMSTMARRRTCGIRLTVRVTEAERRPHRPTPPSATLETALLVRHYPEYVLSARDYDERRDNLVAYAHQRKRTRRGSAGVAPANRARITESSCRARSGSTPRGRGIWLASTSTAPSRTPAPSQSFTRTPITRTSISTCTRATSMSGNCTSTTSATAGASLPASRT